MKIVWDVVNAPTCPLCGEECDTFYYNAAGDVVGCNQCVTAYDAWDLMYEEAYE